MDVTDAANAEGEPPFAAEAMRNEALDESPFTTFSYTKVFHSWHPGHCPIHLADSYPQLWQKYTLVCFALAIEIKLLIPLHEPYGCRTDLWKG